MRRTECEIGWSDNDGVRIHLGMRRIESVTSV